MRSTSVNCLIDVPSTRLFYKDPISDSLLEFKDDERVWITMPEAFIYIKTEFLYELELFVMVKTLGSPKFYIPLTVRILEKPVFEINDPPFFMLPDGYMLNYTINQKLDVYNFTWNVTHQGDDHHMLDFMNFS